MSEQGMGRRDLNHGWRDHYEPTRDSGAPEQPSLALMEDDGMLQPVRASELDRRGLGHIVTALTIPTQRQAPAQESIPRYEVDDTRQNDEFVPDSSIYLG